MDKAKVITEVKHYVECPYCSKSKSRVDHLFKEYGSGTSFGPWYCDECGGAYKGKTKGSDIFVEKLINQRKDKCIVFLKNANVLLAVEGMYFDGDLDIDHLTYYYDEHTCPTNYLRCEMVIDLDDGDSDPHGIFEFVGAIPYVNLDSVDDVRTLIPENF